MRDEFFTADEIDEEELAVLATALSTPPPPELRTRVLTAVAQVAELQTNRRRLLRWQVTALGAVAAALVLAVLWDAGRDSETETLRALQAERTSLLARLENQEQTWAVLEKAIAVHTTMVKILASPRLATALLSRQDGGAGTARVLLDPETGAVALIGTGLPPPQPGLVYALWAIRGDHTPEAAGVVPRSADPDFVVRLRKVKRPLEVTEFALSLETEEGLTRPLGPIMFIGPLVPAVS